jgi:hypothetical protein
MQEAVEKTASRAPQGRAAFAKPVDVPPVTPDRSIARVIIDPDPPIALIAGDKLEA